MFQGLLILVLWFFFHLSLPPTPTPPLKRVMGGLQQDQLQVRQRCSGLYPVRVWKPSRSLQSPPFLYLRLTQLSSMQIHWHETYAKTFNFFIPYTSATISHISGTIQNLSSSLFEFSRTLPSYTYSDFTRCFSDIKWTKWNGIKISSLVHRNTENFYLAESKYQANFKGLAADLNSPEVIQTTFDKAGTCNMICDVQASLPKF